MFDRVDCAGLYIDDRVRSERWVRRNSIDELTISSVGSFTTPDEPEALQADVERLLEVCKQVYLCHNGSSFATTLAELSDRSGSECNPIFAFLEVDFSGEESNLARRKASRASWTDTAPPSPGSIHRTFTFSTQSDEARGLSLLSGISNDIQAQEGPNLVIPIALLRLPTADATSDNAVAPPTSHPSQGPLTVEHKQIARCLDAGAVDVLTTPLDRSQIQGLVVHAYRTRKAAQREMSRFLARRKQRKLSWVGMHDEQPYSYLREAMVSKLMKGICNPEEVIHDEFQEQDLNVDPARIPFIKEQIGRWKFCAHDFTEDELVFGACEIIQHAFTMPGLDTWRLTSDELQTFLLACRAAYNSFVLYHNFRHAIDVLQSVFCFLLHIGALPPYAPIGQHSVPETPITSLLTPFDALTLLISAIGHDVGHPGVNNFFLVKLNAPLAQLYNDNSVLEAFHCAAFSQILRRHWPAAFKDNQLRKLLISSILATDMGVHQKFMQRMGSFQEKFSENNRSVDGWKPQDVDMYKTLVCGLLIKCADISNVARPWKVAKKWTQILQEEFANQGEMEREVGMETALFGGPPELGNIYKLATGQIGFMSIFALPLFEGISDLLPQLQFTTDHIRRNQAQWQELANDDLRRQGLPIEKRPEITVSPRSHSPPADEKLISNSGDGAADRVQSPTSSDSGAYNENNIQPVVTPDTTGPQIEITGSPLLPAAEMSSRKSSSAIPELSCFSIPGVPESARGSISTQLHSPLTQADPSTEDPAVLTAVLYANSAFGGRTSSGSVGRDHAPGAAERPSSSRQGLPQGSLRGSQRHHAHHSSSARTGSNRNSCTRTQSTYSNTMTPISPTTNASSFLAVDSGDEKRVSGESAAQSELGGPDDNSTRPSTADAFPSGGSEPAGSYSPGRSSILGRGQTRSEDGANKDFSKLRAHGTRSTTQSTTTGESIKNETPQADDSHGPRKLPKRRSRLRLAFWKRRNHSHEVRGET
ncbi:3'5'-cyclic nucleotide phosphodiesterase [Penicillium cf. griseofulvum]|uniref:Phosphodiesterase n=1 Tax=Penicillium cf. griseofulvum TaxID=2972120 RepID=A0A9W9MSH0_9EURO|nr:3'5'-cyclic nucleotide phosphodiesterase [Penicillium cf. griseofulvum]KAJ5440308.1 3'5'-cyclic nucleotide phosphodiesterase [Penicillium cf. griseofulvum]KAJ5448356.1 3'5'-cyclic nucleotide phosphodiesterase [Penicillium cf. griseofulvum]